MEKSTNYAPSAPPSYLQATGVAESQPVGQPGIQSNTIPNSQNTQFKVITKEPQAAPLVVPQQDAGQPNTQQPVIIVQQPNMLPLMLNSEPVFIQCPACNARNVTRIRREPTSSAPIWACVLCLIGAWCCVCAPYICDCCMNTKHYCSNCKQYLGTYEVNQSRRSN